MAQYIVDTEGQDLAQLSGTFTPDTANKVMTFGSDGQADTFRVLPATVPWLLIEVYDVESTAGDIGYTLYKTNTHNVATELTSARSVALAEYTTFKIVATHYYGDYTADVWRGDQTSAMSLATLETGVPYYPNTASWKISDTTVAPDYKVANLLAFYPLDTDGSDVTGNYDGTEYNGVSHPSDSTFGVNVADFDDTNPEDYIVTATDVPTGTGDFTVMGWIKKDDASDGFIVSNGGTSTSLREWQVNFYNAGGSYLAFALFDGSNYDSVNFTGITVSAHTVWYHFCATVSGTTMKTYSDGVYDSTNTFTYTRNTNATRTVMGTVPWSLGAGSAYAYDGKIRNIRIYDTALTADQIYKMFMDEGGTIS